MYFHFRELKNKKSAAENPDEFGRLKIEVPHWSAEVRILDDSLNPVAQFETIQPDPKSASGYSTERELPSGAYQIQITLEGKTESKWAPVRLNRLTEITTNAWNDLEFTSSAPLKQLKDTNTSQINAAQKMAQELTWKNSEGDSRLFLFIRTPKPEKYAESFFKGLQLFDERENLITDFSQNVKLNRKQGWLAFNANLPAGGYILRRGRRGAILRSQVVYLCSNWQSEIFIQANKYPTLNSMNVNMKSFWDRGSTQDEAEASEAILNYLRYKSDIRILLENSHMRNNLDVLLEGERQNPWLGILAAHAILKMEEEIQSHQITRLPETQSEDFTEYSELLRRKLIPFLESEIPAHPDVKALLVWRNAASETPTDASIESFSFPFPPMLWLSFRRIYAYSTRFAHLIPVNSLTDCIIDKPLDDSPWTAWSHLNRYPENFAESNATPRAVSKNLSEIKQKAFSVKNPSLPQKPLENTNFQADEPPKISPDQKALQEVSVSRTTQSIVSDYVETGKVEEMPEVFSFDAADQIGQMLENVDAKAVSSLCNVPLSWVESDLENLKEQGKSLSEAGQSNFENTVATRQKPVTETQRGLAILNFAVNSATQTRPLSDFDLTAPPMPENPSVKIENIFNQLHASAVRLWTAVNMSESDGETVASFTPKEIKFARRIALNLEKLAERILRQADFIVNTDQSQQIYKVNDAFRYLLFPKNLESTTPEKLNEELLLKQAEWEKALAKLSAGHNEIKNPLREKTARRFSVRRAMLEDKQNGLQVYLNIIREMKIQMISPENLEKICLLLSDVTLFTSLFTYGTQDDKNESVAKLNDLTSRIESLMSSN